MAGVEERYLLLTEDPDISKVEAHRVFCKRCSKWLKLDETKLYAASVWRCHKNTKSHIAKALLATASAPAPAYDAASAITNHKSSASAAFSSTSKEKPQLSDPPKSMKFSNPSVHKSSSHPRLTLKVPPAGRSYSPPVPTSPSGGGSDTIIVGDPRKGPPMKFQKPRPFSVTPQEHAISQPVSGKSDASQASMLQTASSSPKRKRTGQSIAHPGSTSRGAAIPTGVSLSHIPLPLDLLPDRQASYYALVAEPYITHLEPFRAFCSLCKSWVDLSSRTQYSYGVWKGHVRKSEKHIRQQTSRTENEYETASDHSPDECGANCGFEESDISEIPVGINGGSARRAPSGSSLHRESEGKADRLGTQEPNGGAPNGISSPADKMVSSARITSSFDAAPNGGSSPAAGENPFALKATTGTSFAPRPTAGVLEPGVSEVDLDGEMTDDSEEEVGTSQSPHKLSPAKARAKRRDAMLADPDAAIVESRRVQCRICEKWIKGSNTQEYSSHHWLKHKSKCARAHNRESDRCSDTAETRKQHLEEDPDLEILEPHKALCKLCQKWVKLCSRSRYSASHWLQHKGKCPATQGNVSSNSQAERAESSEPPMGLLKRADEKKSLSAAEERRAVLQADADILDLRADRVQCKVCSRWIKLSTTMEYSSVNWLLHKECCIGDGNDLTGRRQSALEARKMVLEEDTDVAEFEAHRVRCAVCHSWVRLRYDCSYSLGKWLLHRRRCGQQTRARLRSQSAGIAAADGIVGDGDDARDAMDVENWLKDESEVGNDERPLKGSGERPRLGCTFDDAPCLACGHVHADEITVDGDVDMDGGNDGSNTAPATHFDADDEAEDKGKGKGKGRSDQPSGSTRRASAVKVSNKAEGGLADGEPSTKRSLPQSSLNRRVRARAPGGPVRPLPKGKARAAAFMRGHSATTLPPIPPRPRWLDEDERKHQFVTDPAVLKIEPHRVLCKNCQCWIRLNPVVRYLQSVWPAHKESCKASLLLTPSDAKSRARSEKEETRLRLLEEDPYATDVGPHRVTCRACGTNIRLDTTYKYEGSHWRAHRSRCTRIPFQERLIKKRRAVEQAPEHIAVAYSSDSDDSDASSAPRPRPTSFFTAPLIVKPTEMFKRRINPVTLCSSKETTAAAAKAQAEAELAAELKKVATRIEAEGRYTTILETYGDGITSEELLAQAAANKKTEPDGMDVSLGEVAPGTPGQLLESDPESWIPRKRSREDDEAFDSFFRARPLPPSPVRKGKVRTCKLGKDAMRVLD